MKVEWCREGMSNEFILCSDPLIALFEEHKGIPQMVADRLQR